MVGKNVLAAATVYFALTSALALPKDKIEDKKSKHEIEDHGRPHKTGDKDCSSTAPYPTGDSTNTDFGTGIGIPTGIFPTGTGFVTGVTFTTEDSATPTTTDDSSPTATDDSATSTGTTTDDSASTTTALARRAAHPDKGKDDPTPSGTASPTSVEDNTSRTSDDNSRPTALPSGAIIPPVNGTGLNGTDDNPGRGDDDGPRTVTVTITEAPTLTITVSTSVSTSTSKDRQKGKKSKTSSRTSTTTVDDSPDATPVA